MLYAMFLLAQKEAEKGPETPSWFMYSLPVLLVVYVYLLFIAPSRRERQQRADSLGALKKNDEVLTSAGIYGVVTNIKDKEDEVTLKIDDNARIRVLKSSIVRIMNPKEPGKEGGQ